MNKVTGYYGKISNVDVVDVAVSKVTFENGGTHQMSNNPVLKVGSIVAVDSHGSLWVKV